MDRVTSILYAQDIISKILGAAKCSSDVLLLEDGTIAFTSLDSYFYIIKTDNIFPFACYSNKKFKTSDFDNNEYMINNINMQIYNADFERFMLNCFNMYTFDQYNILANVSNLQDIDVYNEVLNMKSDEGLRIINIPSINNPSITYPFMFYNGLVKVNKGDRLDICIEELDSSILLYKLTLFKKRINNTINIYYKTLRLR